MLRAVFQHESSTLGKNDFCFRLECTAFPCQQFARREIADGRGRADVFDSVSGISDAASIIP